MATRMRDHALLRLLQLSSPALPVGAFSYSEGLETLVEQRIVQAPEQVLHWLEQELQCGALKAACDRASAIPSTLTAPHCSSCSSQ